MELLHVERGDVDDLLANIAQAQRGRTVQQGHRHNAHISFRQRQHVANVLKAAISNHRRDTQRHFTVWSGLLADSDQCGDFIGRGEFSSVRVTCHNTRRVFVMRRSGLFEWTGFIYSVRDHVQCTCLCCRTEN